MRKELFLEDGETEHNFIRRLGSRQKIPSPHIIDLYGYYVHKRMGNLLMPLLQGDLKGLLTLDEQCVHFQSDDHYLAQMRNLANAVASLHCIQEPSRFKITGIHHDLKPANVLLHHGQFILSDFGTATLRRPTAGEEQDSLGNVNWSTAPEQYADGPWPGVASPKSDMFALGCIFMELLVHMRGGAHSVEAFRKRRNPKKPGVAPFCEGRKLNHQVSLQLEEIRQEPESVKRCQVADVVRDLLAEDRRDRPSAQDVVKSLNCILDEAVFESALTGSDARRHNLDIPTSSSRLHSHNDQIGRTMASYSVSSEQRSDGSVSFDSPKGSTHMRLESEYPSPIVR